MSDITGLGNGYTKFIMRWARVTHMPTPMPNEEEEEEDCARVEEEGGG